MVGYESGAVCPIPTSVILWTRIRRSKLVRNPCFDRELEAIAVLHPEQIAKVRRSITDRTLRPVRDECREKRDDVEECRLARRVRTDKYLKSVQILLNKPQTSTPERLNSRDHSGSESLSMNAVV